MKDVAAAKAAAEAAEEEAAANPMLAAVGAESMETVALDPATVNRRVKRRRLATITRTT